MATEAMSERRIVAFHEAGHAVAARALGARRVRVSIVPGKRELEHIDGYSVVGDVSGFCEPDSIVARSDLDALRAQCVVLIAGRVAERIATGQPLTGTATPSQIGQALLEQEGSPKPNARKWALSELTRIHGDELAAYHALDRMAADLLDRAVRIVHTNWAAVARLADRLETENEVLI